MMMTDLPGAAAVLLLVLLSGLVITGCLLGVIVLPLLGRPDLSAAKDVAEWRNPTATAWMHWVSYAGSAVAVSLIGGAAVAALAVRGHWLQAAPVALSGLGALAAFSLIKLIVGRPRPPLLHLQAETTSSFPSGHVSAATATYLAIALAVGERCQWTTRTTGLLFVALLVAAIAFSRVYLGVHYPSDVIAGAALGAAWTLATRRLLTHRAHARAESP